MTFWAPPSLDVAGPSAAPPPDGAGGGYSPAFTSAAARLPERVLRAPTPARSVFLGAEEHEKEWQQGRK